MSRDFECWFFHQKAPPDPLRGNLGQFHFLLKIHRDIEQKVGSAVYDTPRNGDSAVTTEWRLGGVSYTAEWQLDSVRYIG